VSESGVSMAKIELLMEKVTLAQLASEVLKSSPNSCCYGRLYSFLPPNSLEAMNFIQSVPIPAAAVPNKNPVTALVGDFSEIIQILGKIVPSIKDGVLELNAVALKPDLPKCLYLALMSPAEKTVNGTNYLPAYEAIDFMKSLLTLSFGTLATYTYVADFEFDAKGKTNFVTESFRPPALADFQQFLDINLFEEIAGRLANQLPALRSRIQKACSFLSYAIDQKDESFKFSSYWIALEVLVGGRAQAIKAELAQIYKKGLQFVDADLRFKEINNLRNNLLHHGEFEILTSYQERLLQLYFWDICIFQIGLRCRFLAEQLARSGVVEQEIAARKKMKQMS
jgi:hypothetical protein